VLNAGPQGDEWSADVVEIGRQAFVSAGGKAAELTNQGEA
jgi:hypothetical protein